MIFHPCASFLLINLPNPIIFFVRESLQQKVGAFPKKSVELLTFWRFLLVKNCATSFPTRNQKKIRTAVRGPVGGRKAADSARRSGSQSIITLLLLQELKGLGKGDGIRGGWVRGTLRFDLGIKDLRIPAEFWVTVCIYSKTFKEHRYTGKPKIVVGLKSVWRDFPRKGSWAPLF